MTIKEAINRLDALIFNTYTTDDKIQWLSRLDAAVKNQIIDLHEGAGYFGFYGYDNNTDMETELIVPTPFDEVYLRWMEAQIHYHNGEYDKFNAAIIMYNSAFESYASYYNKHHMPITKANRFMF